MKLFKDSKYFKGKHYYGKHYYGICKVFFSGGLIFCAVLYMLKLYVAALIWMGLAILMNQEIRYFDQKQNIMEASNKC